GPTSKTSTTPPSSTPRWPGCAANTTRSASTPASATSPPTTNTTDAAPPSAEHAQSDSREHAGNGSTTTGPTSKTAPETSHEDWVFKPGHLYQRVRNTTPHATPGVNDHPVVQGHRLVARQRFVERLPLLVGTFEQIKRLVFPVVPAKVSVFGCLLYRQRTDGPGRHHLVPSRPLREW